MIFHPIRNWFLVFGQVAFVLIVLLTVLVLAAGPSGSARPVGWAAAVLVAVAGLWVLRGLLRQALVVDGDRLGFRPGLTDHVAGWIDLASVEVASAAHLSSSFLSRRRDLILWSRTGGFRGVYGFVLKAQAPAQVR